MPTEIKRRIHTPYTPAPELPPGLTLVTLREAGEAFDHAIKIAAKEGAGTVVWARRFDLVDFAVVLEPEEPLAAARRAIYAGVTALVEALAFHAAPERMIHVEWPDTVFVDGGLVGGMRLAWPKSASEKEPPRWLVLGGMVRTVVLEPGEPGLRPHVTGLEEEGFEDLGPGRLLESFARHFMVIVDAWQDEGFHKIAADYLMRVPTDEPVERTIDGVGDLLVRKKGKLEVQKRRLVPALERAAWFDPETRAPKL